MTATSGEPGARAAAPGTDLDYVDDHGYGWVAFAGVLLLMVGSLNIIEGIAAISRSHFFVANAHYVIGNLRAWGWVVLLIGIAELAVGLGIYVKNQFARWVGVFVLSLNAIAMLMVIPAYPFWSLSVFTLDILAIFGLVAYGGRIARPS